MINLSLECLQLGNDGEQTDQVCSGNSPCSSYSGLVGSFKPPGPAAVTIPYSAKMGAKGVDQGDPMTDEEIPRFGQQESNRAAPGSSLRRSAWSTA
ncbi:hypothetical protein ACFQFQ_31600 [Sulfitobacter porphyrae]|uniref:Uncharacterized protein n=1 Tax=Sulfitobacter porphyrae TaxID=1246864 RepID=A0ABW2BBK6_9RHOB